MTSERMFKLTIVMAVVFVASQVVSNVMLNAMDKDELMAAAQDKERLLKHPALIAVCVADRLALVAAAVSAVMTAVLWLMGA